MPEELNIRNLNQEYIIPIHSFIALREGQVFKIIGQKDSRSDCIIRAFIVVIIAGLGSIKGAIVVGLIIGLVENLSCLLVTPIQAETFVFVIMIIMLVVKPKGLYG